MLIKIDKKIIALANANAPNMDTYVNTNNTRYVNSWKIRLNLMAIKIFKNISKIKKKNQLKIIPNKIGIYTYVEVSLMRPCPCFSKFN